MAKTINMECPICKKKVLFVGVHDDEGNYHGLVGCEYENDPWSGLSYALHHEGWGDCPMCTDGAYSTMGGMLFDTAEDAISALSLPNEPLSVLVNDEPDREYIDYICPRCKDIISQRRRGQRMETVYKCKFHDNCGQRVDWSNPQPYRRPPEGEKK